MLAGYARFVNDNVRTAHLKCSNCNTRVQLTKIEVDEDGYELRRFQCSHCAAVSMVRPDDNDGTAGNTPRRDLGAR